MDAKVLQNILAAREAAHPPFRSREAREVWRATEAGLIRWRERVAAAAARETQRTMDVRRLHAFHDKRMALIHDLRGQNTKAPKYKTTINKINQLGTMMGYTISNLNRRLGYGLNKYNDPFLIRWQRAMLMHERMDARMGIPGKPRKGQWNENSSRGEMGVWYKKYPGGVNNRFNTNSIFNVESQSMFTPNQIKNNKLYVDTANGATSHNKHRQVFTGTLIRSRMNGPSGGKHPGPLGHTMVPRLLPNNIRNALYKYAINRMAVIRKKVENNPMYKNKNKTFINNKILNEYNKF